MNGFTNENILKNKRKCKLFIIWGLIVLLVGFMFVYLGVKQDEQDNKNIVYLNDMIEKHSGEVGEKTYLNISGLSQAFAVSDDTTNAYYFATDGNYYYVLFLKENTYNELKEKDLSSNPERIDGIIKTVDNEIKNIAIDSYNSTLTEDDVKLTLLDYNKYFGDYYLDETISYSDTTSIYNGLAFITIFTGLYLLFVGIYRTINFNSNMKKINPMEIPILEQEMASSDSFYYDKLKLYLTKNYIVSLNSNFVVYKYSDILWMYPFEQRVNGVKSRQAIKIFTNDGVTTLFANVAIYNKAQKETYNEIWDTIINKNNNIKLGYTPENIKYFKAVSKEIKMKKKNGTI